MVMLPGRRPTRRAPLSLLSLRWIFSSREREAAEGAFAWVRDLRRSLVSDMMFLPVAMNSRERVWLWVQSSSLVSLFHDKKPTKRIILASESCLSSLNTPPRLYYPNFH